MVYTWSRQHLCLQVAIHFPQSIDTYVVCAHVASNHCLLLDSIMSFWSHVMHYSSCACFFSSLQDSTLEFEKRPTVPVKYSRELWDKTGQHWSCDAALSAVKQSTLPLVLFFFG